MTRLAGTGALLRLAARRDRVRLTVWVLVLVGLTYFSGSAMADAFPTLATVQSYGRSVASSPALIAMTGPPLGLDTLAGIVVNKVALIGIVGVSLVAVLTVVRHTRAEEEEGRAETVRAAVVGRHAGSLAALLLAAVVSLLVGVGTAVALVGSQVPARSAWLFGAGTTALGLVMAAVALVAAQLFTHARAAAGVGVAVLGVGYVVRAVGDVRENGLVWLSPIGWVQATHVLGDERWWPLLVPVAATVLLVVLAVVLTERRDLGSGLVAARPGRPSASPVLAGPLVLSLRLQRGALVGWSTGVLLLAASMGSLAGEVADLAKGNPTLERYLRAGGAASLADTFLASMLEIAVLLAGAFAVQSTLRLRTEETSGRLELLLATGLSRTRWLLGSLAATVLGAAVLVLAAGFGLGLAHGLVDGDASEPWRLAALALGYLPAAATLAALAVLLLGWLPRAGAVAWAALTGCFLLGWLGGLLEPPRWVTDLSPYEHVAGVPAEPFRAGPPLVTALVAVVLVAVGVVGLRRRDLG